MQPGRERARESGLGWAGRRWGAYKGNKGYGAIKLQEIASYKRDEQGAAQRSEV